MKILTLMVMAAVVGWGIRQISEDESVIYNNLAQSITCYIHYDDNDFLKRRVRGQSESRPFPNDGLIEVDCF